MPAGPDSTPRVGPLGVLSATGAMLYRKADGTLTDVVPGADGQVLTLVGGVPDWAAPSLAVKAFMEANPSDAIYSVFNGLALPQVGVRNGHPLILFDADTDEGIVFRLSMPEDYDGGALTVSVYWTSTAIAGSVVLDGNFDRNNAGYNVDTPSFAGVQSVTSAAPGTSGDIIQSDIAFSNAQADALAAGDPFLFQLSRDADNVSDDMAADLQFLGLTITED